MLTVNSLEQSNTRHLAITHLDFGFTGYFTMYWTLQFNQALHYARTSCISFFFFYCRSGIFGYSIVKRVLYELLSWKKERMEFFFKEENSLDYHNVSRWPWLWLWNFKVQGVPHLHDFHYGGSRFWGFWLMYAQAGDFLVS